MQSFPSEVLRFAVTRKQPKLTSEKKTIANTFASFYP